MRIQPKFRRLKTISADPGGVPFRNLAISNYLVSLILVPPRPILGDLLAVRLPLDPSKNNEKQLVFLCFSSFGLSWTPPGPQTLPKPSQNHFWSTFGALLVLFWCFLDLPGIIFRTFLHVLLASAGKLPRRGETNQILDIFYIFLLIFQENT